MADSTTPERWADLQPEPRIVAALDHAGDRPEIGNQNAKRRWSEKFANACAVAVAAELAPFELLKAKRVLPESIDSGTEPLTPLGSGTRKRIDVTVVDPVLGLEIGVSLKGLNFRDSSSGNFDKNLTGRLYELADEVRLVHEHLPHAFMAAILFLPLDSTADKTEVANSSFANSVLRLRERTGRLDPGVGTHASRCDAGFVALYSIGGTRAVAGRGVTRFFEVTGNPPRRGRPRVSDTWSLSAVCREIANRAAHVDTVEWGEPE